MGFSVSAATAVIFAGLFLALGIFYPAMVNSYERVQSADADQADQALAQADTAIEIDNTQAGTVNVTNRGSTVLPVTETDLVVDGAYQKRGTVTTKVDGNATTELWLPGETLTLEPTGGLAGGSQIRVVTKHGISASTVV